MTREERFADYDRDEQGRPLDYVTGEPLTEEVMDSILASEDPETALTFQALLAEADRLWEEIYGPEPDHVVQSN
jgi:hypothetical protein